MKRLNNLYQNIYDRKNIDFCFKEVFYHTKNLKKKIAFNEYKCVYISKIYNDLVNKTYEVGKPNIFYIYEPKKRRIVSQNMYDKIVNHLVSRYILYPSLIPCLIDENCASRPNKGTNYALNLFYKYNKELSNGDYYVLKCDIKSYFSSIDHFILKEKIKKRIKDKDALNIVFKIIDSDDEGLSIGFMTSQILGIFYLNDLDHFIKEELKIKRYVRYQDDFLLFHKDKEYLKKCLEKIRKFLSNDKLCLNSKTRIYKGTNNFKYLGRDKYGSYMNYRTVNRKFKKKFFLYESGEISFASLVTSKICFNRLINKKNDK